MKGTIKTLDGSGHTATPFDTETGVVEEAEAILKLASDANSAVFDGQTKEQVSKSDVRNQPGKVLQEHEELIIVPGMAGGS